MKTLHRHRWLAGALLALACGGEVRQGARSSRTEDAAVTCGNGGLDTGEQCDGTDLDHSTCTTLGYDFVGGTLGCDPVTCTYDTSACTSGTCGNSRLDPGEECDGMVSMAATCPGGAVAAVPCDQKTCRLDYSGCKPAPMCGNAAIDAGEQCDGANLGGATCANQAYGFDGGKLGCDSTCTLDLTGCTRSGAGCGNGVVEGGEQCDGKDLAGATCRTRGYMDGQLACDPLLCVIDTKSCYNPCGSSRFGYTCQ